MDHKARGLSGGSHTAIRKAIATGRICVGADGKFDPIRPDADWAANSDTAKLRRFPDAGEAVDLSGLI